MVSSTYQPRRYAMAFMNQIRKKQIEPEVKRILKNYGITGRLSVNNHSTLVLKISSGKIDFIGDYVTTSMKNYPDIDSSRSQLENIKYINVNQYWLDKQHSGNALACLREIVAAMNNGNWDRSDVQSDYFDVGWYIDIMIGTYKKPYIMVG
jgi:hypothetical protein